MIEMVKYDNFSFARVPIEASAACIKGQMILLYGVLYEIVDIEYAESFCYLTLKEKLSKAQKFKRWLKIG